MANVLCLDFDDTIVLDNTARQLFDRFAPPQWRDFDVRYHAGELSVEQANAASLDLVEAEAADIVDFVRQVARPREGLDRLFDWAIWNEWLMAVVSTGFDLYVDPILDDLGLDRVVRHAGRASRGYRWRVRYLSPRGFELQDGFKLAYARAFQDAGDFVVYVGDGESDVRAARLAPVVFARSTLLERLSGQHHALHSFETFDDITHVLENEASGWSAVRGE